MPWYEVVLNIVIVIVMLAILISIHEAGHLAAAKIFRVYCFEYSIGFGPKLLHKKRKNGETYFSIRAIPFGGYVAMYGEPGVVPEGFEEPPQERSLESIRKWKKCIILVAGVTLNFILGLVVIYIGDACFPQYYVGYRGMTDTETKTALSAYTGINQTPEIVSFFDDKKESEYQAKDSKLHLPMVTIETGTYPILDSDVTFMFKRGDVYEPGVEHFVAVYFPSSLVDVHTMGSSIVLYPQSNQEVPQKYKDVGVTALPKLLTDDKTSAQVKYSAYNEGDYFVLDSTFYPVVKGVDPAEQYKNHALHSDPENLLFRFTINQNKVLTNDAYKINVISEQPTFAEGWANWSRDVPEACTMIVRGVASLFQPGGFENLSSIVGMTAAMPQIRAQGGARLVFFFAGVISINLAFFNLLPFPGLDGWQLLVTVIEGISRKKVPEKAKAIASLIGMVLLFGLMIAVVIKDVIQLIV